MNQIIKGWEKMSDELNMAVNCIDSLYLFSTLTPEQRALIFKLVIHRSYTTGQSVYSPGDKADAIHIISRGKVRIYRLAENGREQLIRILLPGEFTGELALFKEGIYEAYAECLEDTRICMIRHADFKSLLANYPAISIKMLSVLANRLSNSEQQSTWMSTESAKERLMHYLIRSATVNPKGDLIVHLSMAKKDLASYLGTTPETLSRQWTKLEEEGAIKHLSRNIVKLIGVTQEFNACQID